MATLTSKGQITVPKRVREVLAVQPGDKLAFRIHNDGSVTVEAENVDLGKLRGAIKSKVHGVSVEDMKEAVRSSATRQ